MPCSADKTLPGIRTCLTLLRYPPTAALCKKTPRIKRGAVTDESLLRSGADHHLRADHNRARLRCRVDHGRRWRVVVRLRPRIALALFLELAIALPFALHLAVAVPEFFLIATAFVLVAVTMVIVPRQHRQRESTQQSRQKPARSQGTDHCLKPENKTGKRTGSPSDQVFPIMTAPAPATRLSQAAATEALTTRSAID